MTQWKTSLLLKFVVLLFLVAFLAVFGLTSAGILYGYRTNLYGGSNTSYFASRICYENAREIAQFDILAPYVQEYFPVGVLEDLYRGNFTMSTTPLRKSRTASGKSCPRRCLRKKPMDS